MLLTSCNLKFSCCMHVKSSQNSTKNVVVDCCDGACNCLNDYKFASLKYFGFEHSTWSISRRISFRSYAISSVKSTFSFVWSIWKIGANKSCNFDSRGKRVLKVFCRCALLVPSSSFANLVSNQIWFILPLPSHIATTNQETKGANGTNSGASKKTNHLLVTSTISSINGLKIRWIRLYSFILVYLLHVQNAFRLLRLQMSILELSFFRHFVGFRPIEHKPILYKA